MNIGVLYSAVSMEIDAATFDAVAMIVRNSHTYLRGAMFVVGLWRASMWIGAKKTTEGRCPRVVYNCVYNCLVCVDNCEIG